MRNLLRTLLALALAACVAAAYADPPDRVGRLNYASGTVSFAAGDAADQWTQAVINRPLTGGDRLWSDRDGYGELHVGSTAVRLAPLTSLDVLHLDDDRIQLRLARGTLNVRVRDLDSNDLIEIATPAGAVVLRQPGSYRLSADAETGTARVVVNFGQAEVLTSAQTFTVPSGQGAVLDAGGPPAFEIAGAGDEFQRWSAERDRREDRVASTRYVSPNMTGYEDLDQHGSWRTVPEYGAVWTPTRVAPGWAPYRDGHWAWVSPWGWTWVDDAPWGFAPFHYGRWVRVHDHWAWAPGAIVRRPAYAPALVVFVGGPHWSVGRGPAVGWFPLGWREPYQPWYRASHRHVHNVNVTHVTNVTNVNVRHVHRNRADAVTVVPQQSFVSARPVARSRINVAQSDIARAEVIRDRQPAERGRENFAPERRAARPPAQSAQRDAVAVTPQVTAPARERPEPRQEQAVRREPARASVDSQRERDEQRGRDERRSELRPEQRPERRAEQPSERRAEQRPEQPSERRAEQRPEQRSERSPRADAPDRSSRRGDRPQESQPRSEAPAPRPTPPAAPRTEAPVSRPAVSVEQRRDVPRPTVSAQPRGEAPVSRQRSEASAPRPAQPRAEAPASRPAAPQAAAPAPRAQSVQQPRQDGGSRRDNPQREGRGRPGPAPPS